TGMAADAPFCENGRVAGLLVGGEPRRAALVVAADGVHSRMRHLLGLNKPQRRKRFGTRAHFRLGPGQTQPPWVDVFVCPGYELYVTPLPEKEVLVAGLTYAGALSEPIEQAFHRWWRAQPVLAARLEGAEQVSSLMGTSPLSGNARAGVAPGIVLLGDAAGFLDPIDRKSTRLNSSHGSISYAVFCLKKKKKIKVTSGGVCCRTVKREATQRRSRS